MVSSKKNNLREVAVRPDYSAKLRNDVAALTQKSFQINGIVKISALAEEVRRANIEENVALEDIESLVMQAALLVGAAIEFDGMALPGNFITETSGDSAIALTDLPRSTLLQ
jgi:1-deoxy-D-xylulose 5-phosphate reductoisomerase